MENRFKTFHAGEVYSARSICGHNCIFSFTIVKRTSKTVTLEYHADGSVRCRSIKMRDGAEYCFPLGTYSWAPILRANGEL